MKDVIRHCEALDVGRVTMEKDFTEGEEPELVRPEVPIEGYPLVKQFEAEVVWLRYDVQSEENKTENARGLPTNVMP